VLESAEYGQGEKAGYLAENVPNKIAFKESSRIKLYFDDKQTNKIELKESPPLNGLMEYTLTESDLKIMIGAGVIYRYTWSLTSVGLLKLQTHFLLGRTATIRSGIQLLLSTTRK
jgi:hypothetical protein